MKLRRLGPFALGVVLGTGAACSLTNSDLDDFTGGLPRDAGDDLAVTDTTVAPVDSSDKDSATTDASDTGAEAASDALDAADVDTGGADVGDVGATDSAADSSAVDSGAADSSAADSTATDSAPADTSAADTSATDTSSTDTGATDSATDAADGGAACHPVINEVLTGTTGTATDEFVEIYNPCSTDLSVAGWKVAYRPSSSTSSSSDSTIATLSGTLASKGYLLIANSGGAFSKTPYTADYTYVSGLAQTGGGVGLRDASLTLIDSITWGDAVVGHPFTETKPKTTVTYTAVPGTSFARKPNGQDTNDNSVDFVGQTSTPRAAN